ncbi:MAG: YihY/virulence factor BrkB family protein [Pyrinomonadaceae bacterium]
MSWDKLKKIFVRLYEKSFDEDIFSSSAQVAFYFLFALFPLLLFLMTLFGIILGKADDLRQELFVYLRQIIPGSAFSLVEKTLLEVVQGSSGGKLTIGILITIWSASAGIDSLRIALNAVYKFKEDRVWWKRKLMSLFLIFAIGLSIVIALGIIFYGSHFLKLVLNMVGLPVPSPFVLGILSFLVVLILLMFTFELLYNLVPNHPPANWRWITPGAIVSIILWVLLSKGFGIYLQYFDSYAKTYGSLGAIIILMLWLYLTALVILIGGTINAILDEFSVGKFEKDAGEKAVSEEKTTDKSNAKQAANQTPPAVSASPVLAKTKPADNIISPISLALSPPVKNDLPAAQPANNLSKKTQSEKAPAEKSVLNLMVGSAFGFLLGLFFSKRNR